MRRLLISLLAFVGFAALPLAAHASNCSAYPYNLTNGTTADASQVMADFNLIRNCANNSLAHNGANTDITSITGSAGTLTTPRTISMAGDVAWTSGAFDGSANITGTGTIANLAVTNAKMAAGAALANLGYTPLNVAGGTMTGQLILPVSTIGTSSFRIPQGAAPTTPVNGDIWTTATGAFVRIAGTTITMASVAPVGCNVSGTAGQIVYNDGALGCLSSAAKVTSAGNVNIPSFTQGIQVAGATFAMASPDGLDVYVGNAVGPGSSPGVGVHTNTGGENVGIGFTSIGSLTSGSANIAIGGGSLEAATTAGQNVAVGRHTLRFHDGGSSNVAVGEFAMGGTGPGTANSGNNNVAVGANALNDNVNVGNSNNVAIGYSALMRNTTGIHNVAVGANAGPAGSSAAGANTGTGNVSVGDSALLGAGSGDYNVAVGYTALGSATSPGSQSVGVGVQALYANTGSNNVAIGAQAGFGNTSGAGNAFLGDDAGTTNTTGSNNTAIGKAADLSTAALSGATAIGYNAKVAVSNTTVIGGAANTLVTLTGTTALSAGTTAAAPLVFTAGTNLTSPAAGAMEWNGTNLFVTQTSGPTRKTLVYSDDSRFSGPTQNSQSAGYTFVLADAGGQIYHPSADTTARAWVIPANGSVAYAIGTKLELVNDCSAGIITLSITTDTLVWFPAGSTGTRSIAACGMATLTKVTSTRWVLTGVGVS